MQRVCRGSDILWRHKILPRGDPARAQSQRIEKTDEVPNSKGVLPISREIGCVDHGVNTLGRQRLEELASQSTKAREGNGWFERSSHREKQETSKESKAQGGSCSRRV